METLNFIDPFQFAYREKRGVADAMITSLHNIYDHLEKLRNYVRTLFSISHRPSILLNLMFS